MSRFLRFRLQGPLASWGEAAVGRFRPSMDRPTSSAILGLLGACLGVRRHDDETFAGMVAGYGLAVCVDNQGAPLTDFQTIESVSDAALKGHVVRTRRDELLAVKAYIDGGGAYKSMVPTTREYRTDATYTVVLSGETPFRLEALRDAMRSPVFIPYLGRKSCPLSAPMNPEILEAGSVRELVLGPLLYWQDGVNAGVDPELTFERNDALLSRSRWEFGKRAEHFARLV